MYVPKGSVSPYQEMWKKTTDVGTFCETKIVQFDSSNEYAFVGGTRHFARILALRKGAEASDKSHLILSLKDVVSAAFNPSTDKHELAVVEQEGVKLVSFVDKGMGGISSMVKMLVANEDIDLDYDGSLRCAKYNDNGSRIAVGTAGGKIIVYNATTQEVLYVHSLNESIFSMQFLPGKCFSGEQLLLGGYDSIFFCNSRESRKLETDESKICHNVCYDDKVQQLIEYRPHDDGSFDLVKVNPGSYDVMGVDNYKNSEMKLTMNTAKQEVLLIEYTDSTIIITDVCFNPIAIFPKEYAIIDALLSADGRRLATVREGRHYVFFWQKE